VGGKGGMDAAVSGRRWAESPKQDVEGLNRSLRQFSGFALFKVEVL
jgi:hypothetical protein